jgi:hypothetical protein
MPYQCPKSNAEILGSREAAEVCFDCRDSQRNVLLYGYKDGELFSVEYSECIKNGAFGVPASTVYRPIKLLKALTEPSEETIKAERGSKNCVEVYILGVCLDSDGKPLFNYNGE